MLSFGGITLLDRTLRILRKYNVRDVVIITGYKKEKIQNHVSGRYDMRAKFIHNHKYDTTNNIFSLYLSKDVLSGNDFYIINSDVLFHERIFQALHHSRKKGLILSVDTTKELNEEAMKVVIIGDKVIWISKAIPVEKAHGEYIGIAKVHANEFKRLFKSIKHVLRRQGMGVFYEEAFQRMIDSGSNVTYEPTRGLPWIEIDTVEDLRMAREKVYPRIIRAKYA